MLNKSPFAQPATKTLIVFTYVYLTVFASLAQSAGELMFVGWNTDGDDGFSFVTLVDLPNGLEIHFSDNEWNGQPIGSGGAFNDLNEGEMSWINDTGGAIAAGTVVIINNSSEITTLTVNIGSITAGIAEGGIDLRASNEVLYMYLGPDRFTPTTFLSAISNDGFGGNGTLTNTGLTAGVNATAITGDEDIMVYTNNNNCNGTVAECAALIATAANWVTDDGPGPQDVDGNYPDYPADVCDVAGTLFYPVQYYYSLASGNWNDNNSWSLTSDGSSGALPAGEYPRRTDNVVIRNGHTILVDAIDDNKSCGVSPDGLNRANVGTFASSGVRMFYHTGDIIIDAGGTLSLTTRSMYEGYTYVNGTMTSTADIVNLGNMEITATATFSSDDDLVLSGNSYTTLDNTSTTDDDLYLDWTDALICGTGVLNIGADAGNPLNPTIQYLNGATEAQICASLTITCSVNCGGFTAPTNPGLYTIDWEGPGGVGSGTNIGLWLKADDITAADGSAVGAWPDASGNGNNASQATSGREPLFYNTSALNNMPIVRFDGNDDQLLVADADILDNSAGLSLFAVVRPTNLDGNPRGVLGKRISFSENTNYAYTWFFYSSNALYTDIVTANDRFNTGAATYANANNYLLNMIYDGSLASGVRANVYDGESNVVTAAETSASIMNSTADLALGALNADYGTYLGGDYGEIVQFNLPVNTAQRILINNYLAAKYNIPLANNDVYEMDNSLNGNYDFEVAGIGQAADGSFHKDARGTGIVRINLPDNLDNNEYLMWGHDNTSLSNVNTTDVDGAVIEARLERVWRLSINDNTGTPVSVGTVRVIFDVSSLPSTILGSDLRLLITRNDALFADNDVPPQAGSYNIDNQLITFSNVVFADGDYFTLGTVDNTNSPLPIVLLSFDARAVNGKTYLSWVTASEQNNDYFTIERSDGYGEWYPLGQLPGAGNSTTPITYEYWDTAPMVGRNYYRIKQTDYDGTRSYSWIKLVNFTPQDLFSVFPNPFTSTITLSGKEANAIEAVTFYDIRGNVMPVKMQLENGALTFSTQNLKRGIYFIKTLVDGRVHTYKVIKQ